MIVDYESGHSVCRVIASRPAFGQQPLASKRRNPQVSKRKRLISRGDCFARRRRSFAMTAARRVALEWYPVHFVKSHQPSANGADAATHGYRYRCVTFSSPARVGTAAQGWRSGAGFTFRAVGMPRSRDAGTPASAVASLTWNDTSSMNQLLAVPGDVSPRNCIGTVCPT